MSISTKLTIAAIGFLIVVGTGFWLHEQGRPLNTLLESTHKILGVVLAAYVGLIAYGLMKTGHPKTAAWFFVSLTAIAIIAIIVTGAMLTRSDLYVLLKWHNISTVAAVVTGVVSLFLLIK
jgi:hypothetical protein